MKIRRVGKSNQNFSKDKVYYVNNKRLIVDDRGNYYAGTIDCVEDWEIIVPSPY